MPREPLLLRPVETVRSEALFLLQVEDVRPEGARGYLRHVRALPGCGQEIAEVAHGTAYDGDSAAALSLSDRAQLVAGEQDLDIGARF